MPSLQMNISIVLINAAEVCQGMVLFAVFAGSTFALFLPQTPGRVVGEVLAGLN